MKNSQKQSGIILIYVIVLLTLVGPALWILTDTALKSAYQTRLLNVQINTADLAQSARAWALANRGRLQSAPAGTVFRPSLSDLVIPHPACQITVMPRENNRIRLRIDARSAIGSLKWKEGRMLTLEPEANAK